MILGNTCLTVKIISFRRTVSVTRHSLTSSYLSAHNREQRLRESGRSPSPHSLRRAIRGAVRWAQSDGQREGEEGLVGMMLDFSLVVFVDDQSGVGDEVRKRQP